MDLIKRMTLSGLNGIQRTLNEIKAKVESCDLSRVEREFENFNRHWENVVRKFKENSQRYVVRIPYDADTQIIKSETNGPKRLIAKSNTSPSFLTSPTSHE